MRPSGRLLIVEDDENHAELILQGFAHAAEHFDVHFATGVEEAEAVLARGGIDLVITDWRLSDGEGVDLIRRNTVKGIPVVVMTSFGDEARAVEVMKLGALDYIVKSPEVFVDMPHIAERTLRQWKLAEESRKAEEALRESEERFRAIFNVQQTGVVVVDAATREVLDANPVALALLGCRRESLLGSSWDFRLGVIRGARLLPALDEAVEWQTEGTVRDAEGREIPVLRSTTLSTLLGRACIIETFFDITDRKKAEERLRMAHDDLQKAYETTLAGWVQALDLRDKETEGHTQRVTGLTTAMAKRVGFSEEDLVHIRRGALLHDIGKLAIPDAVLLKPGPLTEDEWVIMRRHPVYAHEWLSAIDYLRPALDIPWCHHEKWDGTGYPRKLAGEEIPLAARLFALVDVWDALSSNRVYRVSWPEQEVLEHIERQGGTHFDPVLVKEFLALVRSEGGKR